MGSEMALEFPRHLLELEALTRAQIDALLSLAARFKRERARARAGEAAADRRALLRGRNVVTLFFENSTRTRSSFEVAAKALGADVLSFQKDASSVAKGESLEDTVRNLDAIGADALIVRHPAAGAPRLVARAVRASVINAGDGAHEHPTQGLLDALSLRERWGSLEGRTVAIVGDIAHSRVARSNIHCLSKLGVHVRVGGPSTLIPAGIEKLGCTVARSLRDALTGADAVMALRIQNERIADARLPGARDYARTWGLNARTLEMLPKEALVLHPGPVNRGVELSSDVLDSPRSLVMDQVGSGVAVRVVARGVGPVRRGARPGGRVCARDSRRRDHPGIAGRTARGHGGAEGGWLRLRDRRRPAGDVRGSHAPCPGVRARPRSASHDPRRGPD